jgi:glutamate synthase (NADPH/NADH) large chain
MTGGVVVVLGKTGRNFAAGMSGGVAYVYNADRTFRQLCNKAMVSVDDVDPSLAAADDPEAPKQRALSVSDAGMGDVLRFDAERLRILIERHLLHTGSARARFILDHWEVEAAKFVKVTPTDYRRALLELRNERNPAVAAE